MADPFAWYELMSSDPAASAAFYRAVVGWQTDSIPSPAGGDPYTLFKPQGDERGIAGMLRTPEGAPPGWIGYIHVSDVDAYAERVKAAGGTVLREPFDVPGMLRIGIFADPQGARFALMKPLPPMDQAAPPPLEPNAPGHVGWHELYAADWEKAWDFYAGLFGWEKDRAMDMGEMGIYQIIRPATPMPLGAVMTNPHVPAPYWNFYFSVDAIDAAAERIKAAGGTVTMGPHEVPGPMWIVMANDPQGTPFALVAPKR